jgi:hypothetical protein
VSDLDQVIERYHQALDAFARGDPGPVKALYSHTDDVTLANPFVGPPAHGWNVTSAALNYASSNSVTARWGTRRWSTHHDNVPSRRRWVEDGPPSRRPHRHSEPRRSAPRRLTIPDRSRLQLETPTDRKARRGGMAAVGDDVRSITCSQRSP